MSRVIKLTYEDYAALPDDGRRYEILDGELEVSPAPSTRHQGVSEGGAYRLVGTHEGAARVRTVFLPDLEIDLGGVWV